MPVYLYIFGYETPRQRVNNRSFYWDDENSKCVLIAAENEDSAQAWGDQIARRYSGLMHAEDLYPADGPAGWIERSGRDLDLSRCPQLRVGEFPDFNVWLDQDRDS